MTTTTPMPDLKTDKPSFAPLEVPPPVPYLPQQTLYLNPMPAEGSFVELNDHRLFYVSYTLTTHVTRDGGFNWQDMGSVVDSAGHKLEGGSPSLVRLPSGGIGLMFLRDAALWFSRSVDEGQTWSTPARLSEPGLDTAHALHDAAIVTSSGRIIYAVYKRMGRRDYIPPKEAVMLSVALRGDDFDVVGSHSYEPHPLYSWTYHSDDDGETWQRNENGELIITVDYEGGGHYSSEEPIIAEYAPGHLMMVHRTPLGRFYQSWSSDDGTNWTRPEPTHIASSRSPGSIKRIPGTDDLLLVWNQASGTEIVRGLQRHRISAAISCDGAATWKNHVNLVCREPDDPACFDVPPVQNYRAEKWSPRLPMNESHTTYPSSAIWQDTLIVMYSETHRRIYRGPDDHEYQSPGGWTMAVPLSLLRDPASANRQRVTGPQRQNLRNAMVSRPDRIVYVPPQQRCETTENQHFLVTPTAEGAFLAVWTTATGEAQPNQHVVVRRSTDCGRTWTDSYTIAPEPDRPEGQIASWGFPVVVPHSGRIYLFWSQNAGAVDTRADLTADLAWRWSDDDGRTWSDRTETRPFAKSGAPDPHPEKAENWVVYQAPLITRRGEVMVGYTRFAPGRAEKYLFDHGCECRFLRFDNILSEQDPTKLSFSVFPENEAGLQVPWPEQPHISCAQEPTLHDLSDGRMICVLRTATGFIYFALSGDGGRTWDEPRPLRFAPDGPKMQQPVCPCPLYKLADGRFILIFHNNDGTIHGGPGPCGSSDTSRWPAYLAVGREIKHPDHPIMFTRPRLLVDNGGLADGLDRTEIATYTSLFEHEGEVYFWYPDHKHYLLGKVLSPALISDAELPR